MSSINLQRLCHLFDWFTAAFLASPQLQQQPSHLCVFTLRIKANDDHKLLLSEDEKNADHVKQMELKPRFDT